MFWFQLAVGITRDSRDRCWLAFVVLIAWVTPKTGAGHDLLDGRILVWWALTGMALGFQIVHAVIIFAELREIRTRLALRAVVAGLLGAFLIGAMVAGWVTW